MATSQLEIHGEHRLWLNESSLWRDDLTIWVKETDQALGDLQKLEDALRDHRKVLQTHWAAINAEVQTLGDHEHSLSQFERGQPSPGADELSSIHGQDAKNHELQRKAHEKLKKHHHTVLAHWLLLAKSLLEKRL